MKKSIIAVSGIVVIGLAVGGIMLFNKPGVQPVLASNLQESPTPEESAAKEDESIGKEGGYATDVSRGLSEADAITDETGSGSGDEGGGSGDGGSGTSVETPSPEVEESTEFDYTLIDPDIHCVASKDQYGQTTVEIDDIMAQTYKETVPGYTEWMGTDDLEQQVRYYFDGRVTKEDVYNYVLTGNMTFPTQQADSGNSSGSGTTSSGGSGGSTQVETPSQQPSGGSSGGSSGGNSGSSDGSSESNPGGGDSGGSLESNPGGGDSEWNVPNDDGSYGEIGGSFAGGGDTTASDAALEAIANGTVERTEIPGMVIQ